MQSVSQFGFRVEPYFTTTQLEYERLKTNLEKIGHRAEKMPDGIGAILLSDNTNWLTTYTKNGEAQIGIYNSSTGRIARDIVLGYPEISESMCDAFAYRLETYRMNKESMRHSKITTAWEQVLQKEPVARDNTKER